MHCSDTVSMIHTVFVQTNFLFASSGGNRFNFPVILYYSIPRLSLPNILFSTDAFFVLTTFVVKPNLRQNHLLLKKCQSKKEYLVVRHAVLSSVMFLFNFNQYFLCVDTDFPYLRCFTRYF